MPIESFPALPARGAGYHAEPWCGIAVVFFISSLLIGLTIGGSSSEPDALPVSKAAQDIYKLTVSLIWLWASIAALCVGYILFGDNGEIKRSPSTCYPLPREVAERVAVGADCSGMPNVQGPDGKSFCVRCLVWRPTRSDVVGSCHHCKTCQRCVTGFDHHCGVFGRCITSGNLPCFYLLPCMMIAGVITCGLSHSLISDGRVHQYEVSTSDLTTLAPPSSRSMDILT